MSDYVIVKADYSQIELRAMAVWAKDDNMIHAFKQGMDIHTYTAASMSGLPFDKVTPEIRKKAKPANFGFIYDISAKSFAETCQAEGFDMSFDEAKRMKTDFFDTYYGIKSYINQVKNDTRKAMYHEQVYVAEGIAGRRRYWKPGQIPLIQRPDTDGDSIKDFYTICKDVINFPIQNFNAEIMKDACYYLWLELKKDVLDAKMRLQVHDEIVCTCHKKHLKEFITLLVYCMKKAANNYITQIPVIVEVEVGPSWGDLTKVCAA